jgi:glycosyltransferase involved in cell wall biosynthesis
LQSKGQDLIVRALSRPGWQDRDWQVSFYGSNQGNLRQLEALIAASPAPDRFRIEGYSEVEEIWTQNQALILASRYEGAALVVVEAMRAGRAVIATDTGRNRELVDHGQTGFIAPAATVDLVADVLEMAYQHRQRLREMGILARQQIAQRYPISPEKDLADRLIQRATR